MALPYLLAYTMGSSKPAARNPSRRIRQQVPRDRTHTERGEGIPITYVPARNTIFLSLALAQAEALGASAIYFGANVLDYSGYPDCRPDYVRAFEEVARLGTKLGREGKAVEVRAPLIQMARRSSCIS